MDKHRRKFLSFMAGTALLGSSVVKAAAGEYKDDQDNIFDPGNGNNEGFDAIKPVIPAGLKEGSKVAITAPASGTSLGEVSRGAELFRSLGCEVIIGDTIMKRTWDYNYLSAPDEVRAAELTGFIKRKDIDCILCARGGYGVMRILPYLDFSVIRENPKIFLGYSDITALVNSVYLLTNTVSFHGPVASSIMNGFAEKYIKKILFADKNFKPVTIDYPGVKTLVPGRANGRLVGGNLSLVTGLLGTPYEIDTRGAVLFLEETFIEPYKIDRMLTQLWAAGKLQEAEGFALGNFEALDAKRNFYPGRSYTIREVLEMRFTQLNKPTVLGLPIGHIKDNAVIPIGINAELDAHKKTLTVLERPVS